MESILRVQKDFNVARGMILVVRRLLDVETIECPTTRATNLPSGRVLATFGVPED